MTAEREVAFQGFSGGGAPRVGMGRVAQGLAGAASVAAVLCLLVVLSAPVAHKVPDNLAHCNNGSCLQHPSPGLRTGLRTGRGAQSCAVSRTPTVFAH